MNEELQINEAARLAGTKAPVQLSQERAHVFVSKTLGTGTADSGKKSSLRTIYTKKPLLSWGGTVLAAAACFLIALFVLRPSDGTLNKYGQPGSFMENQSSHSSISVMDSTISVSTDSTEITVIETVE